MAEQAGEPAARCAACRAWRGVCGASLRMAQAPSELVLTLQCGLDYSQRGSETPPAEQQDVLMQQFRLAKRLQRPLSVRLTFCIAVHQVQAHAATVCRCTASRLLRSCSRLCGSRALFQLA